VPSAFLSKIISIENNHGRAELRAVSVWSAKAPGCTPEKGRSGIEQFISVERIVRRNGKLTTDRMMYISSLRQNAFYYAAAIRSHWGIENALHWVKDASFGEDRSKVRSRKLAIKYFTLTHHCH
jgi:predicted transposase YbfD/YdcC